MWDCLFFVILNHDGPVRKIKRHTNVSVVHQTFLKMSKNNQNVWLSPSVVLNRHNKRRHFENTTVCTFVCDHDVWWWTEHSNNPFPNFTMMSPTTMLSRCHEKVTVVTCVLSRTHTSSQLGNQLQNVFNDCGFLHNHHQYQEIHFFFPRLSRN